ncbi:hypothetical protein HAX54_050244, partial [Datura stramonium]|nr:hypothetical protein [Datura stramonium]
SDQIDTSNIFAALNDQEEAHDQLEKRTSISKCESHKNEKKVVDKEDNREEGSEENSQTTGAKLEANQMEGVGEGIKEVDNMDLRMSGQSKTEGWLS